MKGTVQETGANRVAVRAEPGFAGGLDRVDRPSAAPTRAGMGCFPPVHQPHTSEVAGRHGEFCTDWFMPSHEDAESAGYRE